MSASWPHYAVISLGTLGGSQSNGNSYGSGVTNNGWVNGDSSCGATRPSMPFFCPDAMGQLVITDLGTLGGLNSASASASSPKNSRGLIVGQAQSSQIDPLGSIGVKLYGCITSSTPWCGGTNAAVRIRLAERRDDRASHAGRQ